MDVKIGDIVARKSYQCDVLFRVIDLKEKNGEWEAILYGEDVRLVADAPCSDLVIIDERGQQERKRREIELIEQSYWLFRQDYQMIKQKVEYRATGGYRVEKDFFQIPGCVLHLDGDPLYLRKCMDLYERIGVPVHGVYCEESEMPEKVGSLIEQFRPDI